LSLYSRYRIMLCFYLKVGKVMAHNNRKPNMLPYTLKDFQKQFPDDATCLDWLRNYLYPDGIFCEACNAFTKHHRVKSRPSYSCDHCGHHAAVEQDVRGTCQSAAAAPDARRLGTVANLLRQKARDVLGDGWIGRVRQAPLLKANPALPRRQF